MKKLFLFVCLAVVSHAILAQTDRSFTFKDKSADMTFDNIPEYSPSHYLGSEFSNKFLVLKEEYTYRPLPTPLNPQPTRQVEKPVIYNSLKKLDRYYKKKLKKGAISEDQAKELLSTIVAVGYSIRYADTEELEKILWDIKDIEDLENLFVNSITLN